MPQELLEAYSLESIPGGAADSGKSALGKPVLSVKELERAMWEAVEKLDFEQAAVIRDMIAGEKDKAEGKNYKPQNARRRSRKR